LAHFKQGFKNLWSFSLGQKDGHGKKHKVYESVSKKKKNGFKNGIVLAQNNSFCFVYFSDQLFSKIQA